MTNKQCSTWQLRKMLLVARFRHAFGSFCESFEKRMTLNITEQERRQSLGVSTG